MRQIFFQIFLDTQLHEPKISEKTISAFFRNGVLVFSEVLGSFLLILPTVAARNLNHPHNRSSEFNPLLRSEYVSDWLNVNRAWGKTLRRLLFRINIMVCVCVCVCGGGGGGITRKDSKLNYSRDFGTQKIGGGYHKLRLNGSEGFNKIFGVGILEYLLVAKSEGSCIKFVVSHFLILIDNLFAKYW